VHELLTASQAKRSDARRKGIIIVFYNLCDATVPAATRLAMKWDFEKQADLSGTNLTTTRLLDVTTNG